MEKRQALLYGFEGDVQEICSALRNMKIEPITVTAELGGESVGYLCGMAGYRAQKEKTLSQHPDGAIILFAGLDPESGELMQVLQSLRGAGLAAHALKGMVTAENVRWTMDAVLREYRQEHRIMGALMELKKLRDSIPMPAPTDVPLIMAMMQAESLLSGTAEVTEEEIRRVRKLLQDATGR